MNNRNRRFIPSVMALLVLSTLVALPVVAKGSACQVTGVDVNLNTVQVTVLNQSNQPQMATVVIEVREAGLFNKTAVRDVTVAANGTAQVTASFLGPVTDVISVGVMDEANPI